MLVGLRQWGDEWITGAGREPTELEHVTGGDRAIATMTCHHGREPLMYRDIRPVAGPGLSGDDLPAPEPGPRPVSS